MLGLVTAPVRRPRCCKFCHDVHVQLLRPLSCLASWKLSSNDHMIVFGVGKKGWGGDGGGHYDAARSSLALARTLDARCKIFSCTCTHA